MMRKVLKSRDLSLDTLIETLFVFAIVFSRSKCLDKNVGIPSSMGGHNMTHLLQTE